MLTATASMFQSTPPRGRRRGSPDRLTVKPHVSIHASAREATAGEGWTTLSYDVSIHASAREATDPAYFCAVSSSFQSTPPRGRRRPVLRAAPHQALVSIHASAREATVSSTNGVRVTLFQSTPPRGRRLVWPKAICILMAFQSTPPRGRRPRRCRGCFVSCCFNPRLRAGGDAHGVNLVNRDQGFNPRLRAGGDQHSAPGPAHRKCFNPRLRAGGDLDI